MSVQCPSFPKDEEEIKNDGCLYGKDGGQQSNYNRIESFHVDASAEKSGKS